MSNGIDGGVAGVAGQIAAQPGVSLMGDLGDEVGATGNAGSSIVGCWV